MTEAQTDIYVRGYNQGRQDEATHRQLAAQEGTAGMFKTPDITPAQIVALAGAVLATAAAFGFDITDQQRDAIIQLTTILAGVLIAGDAVVRNGRARGNAKKSD